MRKIKFRAWDKMYNFMTNDFFIRADNVYYDYASRTYDTPNIEVEEVGYDDFEIMQYTGLHDKNGKEIYEGDIVRQTFEVFFQETEQSDGYSFYGNDVGEVVILPSKGVCIKNIIRNAIENEEDEIVNKKLKYYKNLTASRCEAIGNIYENRELIGGVEE